MFLKTVHFLNIINIYQVYTIAEDYYRGKPERIGATGLEILYYYVPEGTPYIDSDETQKKIMESMLKDETPWSLGENIAFL